MHIYFNKTLRTSQVEYNSNMNPRNLALLIQRKLPRFEAEWSYVSYRKVCWTGWTFLVATFQGRLVFVVVRSRIN